MNQCRLRIVSSFRIVPTPEFGEDDVRDIVHRVQQRLGSEVRVRVERVAAIPRTASGKYKAVISFVPRSRVHVQEVYR